MCHRGILSVSGNRVDGLKKCIITVLYFYFFYFDLIVLVCFFSKNSVIVQMLELESTACLGFELSTRCSVKHRRQGQKQQTSYQDMFLCHDVGPDEESDL